MVCHTTTTTTTSAEGGRGGGREGQGGSTVRILRSYMLPYVFFSLSLCSSLLPERPEKPLAYTLHVQSDLI